MAKCTIVSFYPRPIVETKPGLNPNTFIIPESVEEGEFVSVTVGEIPITDRIYLDKDRGNLVVPVPVTEVARSIVEDFCSAQPWIGPEAGPGIFWVEGEYTKEEIIEKFEEQLWEAQEKQKAWALELIKAADDDWSKYKRHRTITDLQRFFAKQMDLTREWIVEHKDTTDVTKCPYCSTIVSASAAVCPTCRNVINAAKFEELKAAIASPETPASMEDLNA